MANIKERVAYLQGLSRGLNIRLHSDEGKLLINIIDILDDMDFDIKEIEIRLRHKIADSRLIPEERKKEIMGELYVYLSENNYLRTVQF